MSFKLFGITFEDGGYQKIIDRLRSGQSMVVPAAPPLSTIDKNPKYLEALQYIDFAIPDSGFMVILARIFLKETITPLRAMSMCIAFFGVALVVTG